MKTLSLYISFSNLFSVHKLVGTTVLVSALLVCAGAAQDGKVTHTVSGNTETWRIDEPNVQKKIIEFQQIRFQPGDQVRVGGGGCVQTGGSGKTWKRYVDPLGPNSDHLYHGMVLIPGAIGELPADDLSRFARLLIVKGQTYTVKGITDPRKAHLWLGYEDDGYGDNGYWGQDEGTQGQCKIGNSWVEHAFVVVYITHSPPTTAQLLPYDLVLNNVDDNLILLNAKWGAQVTPPNFAPPDAAQCGGSPPSSRCTSQMPTSDNSGTCYLFGYDGHHNWAAGTYDGFVYWESKSPFGEDDDYNIRLVPMDNAGVTSASGKAPTGELTLLTEFDSDETIDHFTTPWWQSFHDAVKSGDAAARQMIDQRRAVVTGLVGLDCAHSCSPEIHPVWALAINVNDSAPDEEWAMFVRRWGNEGFCSDDDHILDDLQGDKFTFRLPWRPGATSVSVLSTDFKSRLGQAAGPSVTWIPNQAVFVSFFLTAPQSGDGERVHGSLHLQWVVPPGARTSGPAHVGELHATISDRATHGVVHATAGETLGQDRGPEGRMEELVRSMTPAQRQTFAASLSRKAVSHDEAPLKAGEPAHAIASLPARGPGRPRVRTVPDAEKKAEDQRIIEALHQIYGPNIPGTSNRSMPRPPR